VGLAAMTCKSGNEVHECKREVNYLKKFPS
jgi:hypothetical protein